MDSCNEYVQLLRDVLPIVDDSVHAAARKAPSKSRELVFYTEIRAPLKTMELHAPHLQQVSVRGREEAKKCKKLLKGVLDFLEEAGRNPNSEAEERWTSLTFPYLENIRAIGQIKSSEKPAIPYQSSSFEEVLEKFDAWARKMELIIKFSATPTDIPSMTGKSSRPSRLIRKSAMDFRMTATEHFDHRCPDEHNMMLLLETQRHFRDSDDHVAFNLLFESTTDQEASLQEGRVYVMLPKAAGGGVVLDMPSEGSRKAPPTRRFLPDLCSQVRKANRSTSLNLRLEDAKFYETRQTPSTLPRLSAKDSDSMERVLVAKPIINQESKIMLAVLVAYSVLYLSGTSWLPVGWDKSYFRVLKVGDMSSFVLRPLLASRICSNLSSPRKAPGRIHKHPDLLQLGIMLLEIMLKEPIEDIRKDEDIDLDGREADTNYFAANRTLDDNGWDVHEGYRSAVTACLHWDVPLKGPPYDDLEYSLYVYDNVLKPLEGELKALCGFDVTNLDGKITKISATLLSDGNSSHENDKVQPCALSNELGRAMTGDGTSEESAASIDEILMTRSLNMFDEYTLSSSTKAQLSSRADKWLSCFIESIYGRQHVGMMNDCQDWNISPVKIAVLDSGIDPQDITIAKHLKIPQKLIYRDFITGRHETLQDSVGHGTHTAAILLELARTARIYVARIVEDRDLRHPEKIAEALEYAISEWKVDIICMPFGCPRLDRDLHNTQKAIKKAHSENIIMLAAAANHGLLDNVSYPANQDEVICVGSTDGLGNRSHFTPAPEKGVHISVLGEAVPSDWQDNMSRRKSGTSFAVPIAAATASVIIDYLQRRGMSWTEEKKYHASKIKTRKGIVSVVEKHAAITDQGFCFLRPWKLFEKDFETIDHILLDTLRHV